MGGGLARGKESTWAPGREGGPFLTGGATALTSCWGEGYLPTFILSLPPEPEPEAA